MRGEVDLIFEHPSGGRLYQSGFHAVPEDLSNLGVSLLVVATERYRRQQSHKNVVLTLFPDEEGLPDWRWLQIENMVRPAVQKMATALEAGKGVLSVCRAGINRSSFLSALAISAVSDLEPLEVIAMIREKRDPDCLNNEDFRKVVLYGF